MTNPVAKVIPARQKRSRATYDRLIRAVEASAADGSLMTASMAELARRAGLSTGAFYGRFTSKAAAVTAVLDRQRDALVSRMSLLGAQMRPSRDLRGWIEGAGREFDAHARATVPMIRVLIASGETPPEGASAMATLRHETARLLVEWGVAREAQAEARAGFILALMEAMSRDAALHGRKPDLAAIETAALWYLSAP